MQSRKPLTILMTLLVVAALPAIAADFATMQVGAGAPSWNVTQANGGLLLTISGNGRDVRREFGSSGSVSFDLLDDRGALLPDGSYTWELVGMPVRSRDRSENVLGDPGANRMVSSGGFTISGGSVVDPARGEPTPLDQVFVDDVIVQGSLCVGLDCVNGENFGFDTLRLKENNLRMDFEDTSNSSSFPTNDWGIVINDSSNGGSNYFGVEDRNSGRMVFRVEAGAPSNNLVVEADGDVGIKTLNPVVDLHIVSGDTPTVRLEQDGSSGFTPQTWDVAGNESGFFIRDVTNGSKLSLRIEPNTPAETLFLHTNRVEIENVPLEVRSTTAKVLVENTNAGVDQPQLFELSNPSGNQTLFRLNDGTSGVWDLKVTPQGFIMNNPGGASFEMLLETDGDMTIEGMLTQNSSRTAKENFEAVDRLEILNKLAALPITEWHYKDDQPGVRHIGPFSEDFHAAFGLNGTKNTGLGVLDVQGVALASIQALNELVVEKDARIDDLEGRLAALEAMIEALSEGQ